MSYPNSAPGWGQQQQQQPPYQQQQPPYQQQQQQQQQQPPYQQQPPPHTQHFQADPSVSPHGLSVQSSGTNVTRGSGGSTHSYSHEELRAFAEFINEQMVGDADLASDLPIDPNSPELFTLVGKGLLLAKLVNKIRPGLVDPKKLAKARAGGAASVFQVNQNLSLGIQGCRDLGCVVVNIGPEDLREGKPHLVLGLIWQCVKIALLSAVNLDQHPELVVLLEENEDITRFMNVAPEVNLLRWFNFHLRRAGHHRQVNNFSSDIQDAENYLVLLSQIAPHIVPPNASQEPDPTKRAQLVAQYADQLGCGKMITPADILSGNDKLNLVFTAYLFNKFPGLELLEDNVKQKEDLEEAERLLKLKFEEEAQARDLQWKKEEEERRLAWEREEQERKLRVQREEEERRRKADAEAAALASQRSQEEARFAAERAAAEEAKRKMEEAEAEAQRKLEEDRRRLEAQLEASRRAEEERKRQFEAEQRLAQARLDEQAAKLEATRKQMEEDARRRAFEEEQKRLEEEQKRRDEEEEKKRQAAWAAYMEQQRLEEAKKQAQARDAQEAERLKAWADYNRKQAEEAENARRAAEAERQRQEMAARAAAEEERRRQEAWAAYNAEQERQRQAAEQQRMRQLAMAQEADRQRMIQAQQEAERRRQMAAAAEAERQRQLALQQQQMMLQQQQQQYMMTQQYAMRPMMTVVQPPPQPQVHQVTTKVKHKKFPIQRMVITAIRARRLAKTETIGKSDPYVVSVHNGRRFKSSTHKNTQDPTWNHDFEYGQVQENDTINISIYDKETLGKDHFMGELNLIKSDFENNKTSWFQLRSREYRSDRVHGDIELNFRLYY